MYSVSKVLKGAELYYQKIERLVLALVVTARKLRHYFQGHSIIVRTSYPIRQILKKLNLAERMVTWAIELFEYAIEFVPRTSIKSQVLADFLVELSGPTPDEVAWILFVDSSSNLKGSGAGVGLEEQESLILKHSLRFNFSISNNQAEYEALIAGMK